MDQYLQVIIGIIRFKFKSILDHKKKGYTQEDEDNVYVCALRSDELTSGDGAGGVKGRCGFETDAPVYQDVFKPKPILSPKPTSFARMKR